MRPGSVPMSQPVESPGRVEARDGALEQYKEHAFSVDLRRRTIDERSRSGQLQYPPTRVRFDGTQVAPPRGSVCDAGLIVLARNQAGHSARSGHRGTRANEAGAGSGVVVAEH